MKRDERNILRLLTKEIEIPVGKATVGGEFVKIAITLRPTSDTGIQTASCVVTKFS